MLLFLLFPIFLWCYFDEEEIREDTQIYFEEIRINPNYDSKDKLLLFPLLNENDVEKIIEQRRKGYFKNLRNFKDRTKIHLPDSIFEKYFEFELRKRKISFYSYWEKEIRVIQRLRFYQDNSYLNLLWTKKFGNYEFFRFSYIFNKNSFKFILGDYFINKGCGLLYGISSFYNIYKNLPFIPETKYISSSSFNRGLRGFYTQYKFLFIYFSSKKLREDEEEFREQKGGAGFFVKNKFFSLSLLFEKNLLSEKLEFLNKKEFYQSSIDLSVPYKSFNLNFEYLPFTSSFFIKFSSYKKGFIFYKISEKNYDFHSSYITGSFNARDEEGFSVFGNLHFNFLKTDGYILLYRKFSEPDYSYKFYNELKFKEFKNFSFKIDYKNSLSSYKRERYGINLAYKFLSIRVNYLVAEEEGDFSYGNMLLALLKFKFLKFCSGIFNTQDYNSRIYFFSSTSFPYYQLLPLYGRGSLISAGLNFKFKGLKIYSGLCNIKGENRETFINGGIRFEREEIL